MRCNIAGSEIVEAGTVITVLKDFEKDFEAFAESVAKAQAELDAWCGTLSATDREWLTRYEAAFAGAESMMQQMGSSLPTPADILSPAAIERLLHETRKIEDVPRRSIVRRPLKLEIGFMAKR